HPLDVRVDALRLRRLEPLGEALEDPFEAALGSDRADALFDLLVRGPGDERRELLRRDLGRVEVNGLLAHGSSFGSGGDPGGHSYPPRGTNRSCRGGRI